MLFFSLNREDPFWSIMLRSGLAPKPFFSFWLQWQAYMLNVAQMGSPFLEPSILFAVVFFFFSHTHIQRSCIQSKKKLIPQWTKPFRAVDLIVQFFGFLEQGRIYSRAQFSAHFGKENDDKAGLQDDSVFVGSRWHPDLKNIKYSAAVIWSKIVARFVLRLIWPAHIDYSWTIRSLQIGWYDR